MTLHIPPNMEGLVSAFLRAQPEAVALVADRVYTEIPADATYPLFRVSQLGDRPAGGAPLHLVAFTIQVEAFGGSKADAWRGASTARALISERLEGSYPEWAAVVSGSSAGSLIDLPDETFAKAKPRWLFSSTIYARPGATLPQY